MVFQWFWTFLTVWPERESFFACEININKTNAFLILLLRLDENTVKPMAFACLLWFKHFVHVSLHNVSFPNRSLFLMVLIGDQRGDRTHTKREAARAAARPGIAEAVPQKHNYVYKTNGFLFMISNLFYSTAPVEITSLFQECVPWLQNI